MGIMFKYGNMPQELINILIQVIMLDLMANIRK